LRHLSRPLAGAPCILLAASLWGTTATVRTFAPASAGPLAVGAVRIVAGGLFLLVIALRGGVLRSLVASGTRVRCLLVLGAACVAGYQSAFFAATARTGVAVGTVVTIGAAPVFTGILSMMTGRRSRPGARWLAATAAAITGCAMLVTSGHPSGASAAGVALALLASLCYAVYAVTASYLITNGAYDRAHARPGRAGRGRGPRAGRSRRAPDHNRARWPWGSRRRPGHRGLVRAAPHGRRHI
jgi:drug/metabolite transporter, DME family